MSTSFVQRRQDAQSLSLATMPRHSAMHTGLELPRAHEDDLTCARF